MVDVTDSGKLDCNMPPKGTPGPILRYSTRSNRSVLLTTVNGKVLRNAINLHKHIKQEYFTNVDIHSPLCIRMEPCHRHFYCLFKCVFLLTAKQTPKVCIIGALCWRNTLVTGGFFHKKLIMRRGFSFNGVIMLSVFQVCQYVVLLDLTTPNLGW